MHVRSCLPYKTRSLLSTQYQFCSKMAVLCFLAILASSQLLVLVNAVSSHVQNTHHLDRVQHRKLSCLGIIFKLSYYSRH
jgi:hypothetical protein